MNAVRQISRRLDRTTGTRTRSASSDCIVKTVSFGSDPLKAIAGTLLANVLLKSKGEGGWKI